MKVIDLTDELRPLYCVCLEDWSAEMIEASNHKENWCNHMKDKGLRVKLALDDAGKVGGMIEYVPIEYSFTEGSDLYFINCIWVHGHKEGRGNFQKRGMGKALLQAAEDDARVLGAKGMVAFGVSLPFWIPASWFRKNGYTPVDKNGMILLWKPFSSDATAPRWIRPKKQPEKSHVPDEIRVTAFLHGYCPAQNAMYERAKRAAAAFGDKVIFETVDTSARENYLEWGISNAIFIEGKNISAGPPKSYESIKRAIKRSLWRKRWSKYLRLFS